jgi:hypothetical protein
MPPKGVRKKSAVRPDAVQPLATRDDQPAEAVGEKRKADDDESVQGSKRFKDDTVMEEKKPGDGTEIEKNKPDSETMASEQCKHSVGEKSEARRAATLTAEREVAIPGFSGQRAFDGEANESTKHSLYMPFGGEPIVAVCEHWHCSSEPCIQAIE